MAETNLGRFLKHLTGGSSIERLDALIADLDRTDETIDGLREQEERLRSADTSRERKRPTRNAAKFDSLAEHVEMLQTGLSAEALSDLRSQRDLVFSLEQAATVLADVFESEPLAGVGTSAWKELWESARRYSEAHAFPDEAFPTVGAGARCVLCQQPLEDEGRARLHRFEEFVRNDTQVGLVQATRAFQEARERVSSLDVLPEGVETNLSDLADESTSLISQTRSVLNSVEATRAALLEALSGSEDFSGVNGQSDWPIAPLREAAEAARQGAQELTDPEAIQASLADTTKRRVELELLQSVKERRDVILGEIGRLASRERLEEVKNAAATGPVTKKISELSEQEVTEVIRDRFTRETARLQLERITIAKTRAERTALLHQPKLVGARQNVAVPRVFSEGERTALGLAAFFTEAHLDASKSALILDDPVSSLDHIRRGLVAGRLVELGTDRQVIVFTHDVAFVGDLKREARGKGVKVTERSVLRSRRGERQPGACGITHPWKARDVAGRLGELRADLARIKREAESWDQDGYETAVAVWAGSLSETWERVFSQELVGPVLAEGGLELRPHMVKVLARFSAEDDQEFQASYSRMSQWAKRHDKSEKVNYVAPEIESLEQEFALVDAWFGRARGYKN